MIDMISNAISSNVMARYVLFDSWFGYPTTIKRINALGMHSICMLKDTDKIHYDFQGRSAVTLREIYKTLRKKLGKAKILASTVVGIGNDEHGAPVSTKVVFVRSKKSKKWLGILSTDIVLGDEEIVKLYKRRWDIEVFFKMSKSFLNLAKEFYSRSYDALVAQATLVCCRYIMLEIAKRESCDARTIGGMFYAFCDEMKQISLAEALALLLQLLDQELLSIVKFPKDKLQLLIQEFIQQLPPVFNRRFLVLATQTA